MLLLVVVLFGGRGLECIGTPDAMLLLLTLLVVPSPGGGGSSGFSDIVCVSKSFSVSFGNVEKHFPIFPYNNLKKRRIVKETAYKETNGDAVDAPISLCSISLFLFFCVRELVTFSFPT